MDGYELSDERERVDVDAVWAFLNTEAYWGRGRTRSVVEQQIAGAWRVAGAYEAATGALVGFARAVSDGLAFAYLADVFVVAPHRGRGLGHALVTTMIDDGPGRDFRWMLHTADAHTLYAAHGFGPPDDTVLERPGATRSGT